MGTVLKALLQQRHLQTVSSFNHQYDQLARKTEPELIGAGPKKAQFYRWLSGDITGLPYPHHCRILEAMFPGWSTDELFEEYSESIDLDRASRAARPASMTARGTADLESVFPTRTDFLQSMSPSALFHGAARVDMAGLSLNLLCQQLSDTAVIDLLEAGTTMRCLFLDPRGHNIRDREVEEGHEAGVLSSLTELNMQSLRRICRKVGPDVDCRLQIRTYDEPIRFNITVVDSNLCIVQPYMPRARGVESPTFVARKSLGPGIFDTFSALFESMWSGAREVAAR
ncbi:DUF5919 domain-containing protein [Nocardia sp. 2YAB30]|uniref:DUF5919 domain-containing protein n=1 Tax=unclassified Nocardia TaxID=2637762 RepID=UPI003F9AB5C1